MDEPEHRHAQGDGEFLLWDGSRSLPTNAYVCIRVRPSSFCKVHDSPVPLNVDALSNNATGLDGEVICAAGASAEPALSRPDTLAPTLTYQNAPAS